MPGGYAFPEGESIIKYGVPGIWCPRNSCGIRNYLVSPELLGITVSPELPELVPGVPGISGVE